jgi:NAD+ synthase (glutamine-hydrolysing)
MRIKNLRVGAAQVFTGTDIDSNLEKMEAALLEAAQRGVELLLFPECALSGYAPAELGEKGEQPYSPAQLSKALKRIARLGKEKRMALVVGTAWFDEKQGWVNRAFVTHPSGKVAGWQDKCYLIGWDCRYFTPAESLATIKVLGIQVGIGICFDLRFPEVWRTLSRQGAQILLNPLAAYGGGQWKVPVMSAHMRSRAAENQRFLVSANCGPQQMAVSEIYDPAGLLLATANPEVEEVISADLKIGEFVARGRRGLPDFLSLVREQET